MLELRTAHYRYSGPDRLDTTVKGQHAVGKILAPTWDMVMAVKKYDVLAHAWYINEYVKILNAVPPEFWDGILKESRVTLVCFCNKEDFCHRNLLVEYMRTIRKFPVIYTGWVA